MDAIKTAKFRGTDCDREGVGDVSCEGPISSWMCCIDQKKKNRLKGDIPNKN